MGTTTSVVCWRGSHTHCRRHVERCSNTGDSSIPTATSELTAIALPPTSTFQADPPSETPSAGGNTQPSLPKGSVTKEAADLLLAQQLRATIGGGGEPSPPECRNAAPKGGSTAYLSDFIPENEFVDIVGRVTFCATGFDVDKVVDVTITVGQTKYLAEIRLDPQPVPRSDSLDPNPALSEATLFNGVGLTLHKVPGTAFFQSDEWIFVPPSGARDSLVATGRMRIDARQSGGKASSISQLARPRYLPPPGMGVLDLRRGHPTYRPWCWTRGSRASAFPSGCMRVKCAQVIQGQL
jgi:hypothetical protein